MKYVAGIYPARAQYASPSVWRAWIEIASISDGTHQNAHIQAFPGSTRVAFYILCNFSATLESNMEFIAADLVEMRPDGR